MLDEFLEADTEAVSVYRSLLTNPSWTLHDVQRHTGLTEDEVRAAVDRLSDLSLLSPVTDTTYLPMNPETILGPVLRRREAQLDAERAHLSRHQAVVAEFTKEYAALGLRHTGGAEHLVGVNAVRTRLEQLSRDAVQEVCTFTPGGAVSAAGLESARPLDQESFDRGVRMRSVYLDSVRNDQPTSDYATWLTSMGGQVRTVPALPMRMIICDREVAVVPVNAEDSRQGALVVRYQGVVQALAELFELVWAQGVPLGAEAPAAVGDGASERDRVLLKLLSEGMTDQGIARKLGLSVRTIRRLMSDLMKRLDAQSRFEAGAEAVRRGWL
ncbi:MULTISPECIES: LuxR C-terminal-related transcriptional regulator [Streptomyces]|uniref:LuxR C-terminal-related transcriptional regulator n=1 Tax=Streptomyces TaxID=1883 RepID=UPI0006E246FD|nr:MULTISPECIES: LuxR C-terminal-related transcriptional regulator [Streptomyces]MCL6733383.1 LuxR C-terminal-related transcriptional regulator [Streptomyces neyagawaensis]MDE1685186.1 LuxR C-terminal-related transcriptional regulator [Streptomyces neyagawaensis]MDG5807724.1 LuxR C-terminal-related transcriptional regulator [Streptomyces ossamyceticus]